MLLNLKLPEHSYMYGFIQADSHLQENSRNRGRLEIELNKKDILILEKFKEIIYPAYSSITERTRDTNFKNEYQSAVWRVYNLSFRNQLKEMGLPCGKKSKNISVPFGTFSKRDYFRGLIDGDGSLGLTKLNKPFISLCTSSENIKNSYLALIKDIVKKEKIVNRNKRDSAFNIMLNMEDSQKMVFYLYYKNCLSLRRKYKVSERIMSWTRPKNMRRVKNKKFWTTEEDNFILNNPIEISVDKLDRSKNSITTRRWRITKF